MQREGYDHNLRAASGLLVGGRELFGRRDRGLQ
jgi:hypothetical protein